MPKRLLALLVVAAALLALAAPHPAWGQEADPPSEPAPAPSEQPPPWDVVGRVKFGINSWLTDLLASALDPVLSLLGRTILATPQVGEHPRVRELWRFSLLVADATLVLFVMVGSGIVMTGGLTSQVTMKELLPRLVVAAGAANLSLLISGQLISLANALSIAVLGTATDTVEFSTGISERIFHAGNVGAFFLIMAIVVLIFAVLIIVAYIVRVAVLVILLSGAPFLLIAHALPQTEHVARVWWRLVIGMIAAPVVQALLVAAAVRVFLTGGGILGLPSGGSFVDLLVIGCLLYLLWRIPLWTINAALGGAGSRAWASAKQKTVATVKAVIAA